MAGIAPNIGSRPAVLLPPPKTSTMAEGARGYELGRFSGVEVDPTFAEALLEGDADAVLFTLLLRAAVPSPARLVVSS